MKINVQSLRSAEIYSLYALVFFLPLFEAPKNIAISAMVILWITRSFLSSDWGGAWSKWDTSSILIIIAGAGSVLFGLYHTEKGITAIGDILSYTLVFMILRRSSFDKDTIRNIFVVAITSTLITLAWGYWNLFHNHTTEALTLNSVGHVNHSAIYLAIVSTSTLALVVTETSKTFKFLFLAIFAFFCFSILIMAARGAILPLAFFIAIVLISATKTPKHIAKNIVVSALAISAFLFLAPGIVHKTLGNVSTTDYTSKRLELANTAFVAAMESPIFGVGLNNFGKISEGDIKAWEEKRGHDFDPSRFFYSSHAHGLYSNTLAVQGVTGLLAVLGFLGLIGHHIFTTRPSQGLSGPMLWYSALGAWVIVVFGGVFNTTLHHEHGMLAMITLGIYLSSKNIQSNVS